MLFVALRREDALALHSFEQPLELGRPDANFTRERGLGPRALAEEGLEDADRGFVGGAGAHGRSVGAPRVRDQASTARIRSVFAEFQL